MPDLEDQPVFLEPELYGHVAYFYKDPNPRWVEILKSDQLMGIVSEWTGKVWEDYITRLAGRTHTDDEHPGAMEMATIAEVFMGGYRGDRWVGQITVGVEYAAADEFGRHSPSEGQNDSTYEGSEDLRGALYAHLPRI